MKFLLILLCAGTAFAQQGDEADEIQAPPPASMKIPPAPPLPIGEALKSFRLAPGFEIEVAACEPMIEAPVEIEFAPDGGMFVLEMRGFMPNVEGKGEDQPIGRVSLLHDTDGDGRMDRNTVFADGLVMPRAICAVRGGLLVAEPPQLWFFKDTNGDGKADEKTPIANDYGNQSNPEHNSNGLIWGRDNWIYSANHAVRYREADGAWEKEPTNFRGQWGITQDDFGRLFYNSNSDQLRGDLVPPQYLSRNPNFKTATGLNVQIARDQGTFPLRINPGVNRGYQKGTLKPDGTLAKFTGACGPVIYRGDMFPREFYGAAFVCEPTANMVRCNFIREQNAMLAATNAFPGTEFLGSTDERFRPVNLFNGPDGALYVVDMYRGVIQHRIYITTFLRNQALDRGLDKHLNMGRIYRVKPAGAKRPVPQSLAKLTSGDLVNQLGATNGWTRDTAQQLLVEKRDKAAVSALKTLAAGGRFPGAIHALWVLHAMGQIDGDFVPLASPEPKVRATAIRVIESSLLSESGDALEQKILALSNDPSADVRLQLMFTLSESKTPQAGNAMAELLEQNAEHPLIRDAAISGLRDRELSFLSQILARSAWNEKSAGKEEVIRELAQCVANSRDPDGIDRILSLAASRSQRWQQYALLDGTATLIPAKGKAKEAPKPKPIQFAAQPSALAKLAGESDAGLKSRLEKLQPLFVWPGQSGVAEAEVKPLTAAEKTLWEDGKALYPTVCGACHQPHGQGFQGLAPPLVDSDWTTGSPERLARIALQGVRGPINVKGTVWELDMPGLSILSDEEIAALLTYVRREWGHSASPVAPELVGKVRKETEDRLDGWSETELLNIK